MHAHRWWRYRGSSSAPWAARIVFVALALLVQPLAAEEAAQPEAGPAGALKERAGAFWEAKVKQDYAAQHGFLEPKLRRTMSVTDYIKRQGPVQYLEAHVDGVKVEEARGFVTVRIRFQVKLVQQAAPIQQETVVHEEWVRRGGEWYRGEGAGRHEAGALPR